MRSLLAAALLALATAVACSVELVGAPCQRNDQCPSDQFCSSGLCAEGTAPASGTDASQLGDASVNRGADAETPGLDAATPFDASSPDGGTRADAGSADIGSPDVGPADVGSPDVGGCPPDGTAAGSGCSTTGATACSGSGPGGYVLTCTQGGNGCKTWVPAAVPCTALGCTTLGGGGAHCS